jgi:hypothetical protein
MNQLFDGSELYKQWLKIVTDTVKVPQSPDQLRREWLKTLKTDELWEVHSDVVQEIRSRT